LVGVVAASSAIDSNRRAIWTGEAHHIPDVFLHIPIAEFSSMTMTSQLNGGAGLAGKSGRKTANACDTNASEMSADTTAHFILVARNSFTVVSHIVVQ
jgi:hypothetical protein